jgi:hypothetical protein
MCRPAADWRALGGDGAGLPQRTRHAARAGRPAGGGVAGPAPPAWPTRPVWTSGRQPAAPPGMPPWGPPQQPPRRLLDENPPVSDAALRCILCLSSSAVKWWEHSAGRRWGGHFCFFGEANPQQYTLVTQPTKQPYPKALGKAGVSTVLHELLSRLGALRPSLFPVVWLVSLQGLLRWYSPTCVNLWLD